ncbi:hypothetical protein [Blastococcus sp. SYSU DS0541]
MSRTAWRVAGSLALAHVVLILVGISQQRSPRLGDGAEAVAAEYVDGDLARIMAGGYVESVGFLLLLPVLAFLARALSRSETGGWASQTAFAAGIAYVALSLAPGLAAGAAALYGAQHGADMVTVSLVNDVRNFTFFLSVLLLGVHAAGVGIAVLADGELPPWLGWAGLGTGLVLVASVPAARLGAVDWATVAWMVWFLALATVMLRYRPGGPDAAAPPVFSGASGDPLTTTPRPGAGT